MTISAPPDLETARVRAKNYQLVAIAQMASQGQLPDTISSTVGLPARYITRLLQGGVNAKFDKHLAEYQERTTKMVVGMRFKMFEGLDGALEAIMGGIASNDTKVAADNGWRLWEYCLPSPHQGSSNGPEAGIQLTINSPQVQATIGQSVDSVAVMLQKLHGAIAEQNGSPHTIEGDKALPTPPSQLEVTEDPTPLIADLVEVENTKPSQLPAILRSQLPTTE